MEKVSVVIVNINTKDVLYLCLKNLSGIYENLEVIVCDMNSQDNSAEMVEREFPLVKLCRLPNNGLAFGLNKGVEIATGDYILYLGSDAFPKKGTIEGLVDYLKKHESVGGAVAKVLLRDGSFDMDTHRGFPTPWVSFTHFLKLDKLFPNSKHFAKYFMTYENLEQEHEIDASITHFLFVSKKAQDKVGKWDDKNFFLYGEDIDFCFRLKESGFKIMYLPNLTAEHWKGVAIGIRKVSQDVATKTNVFDFMGKKVSRAQSKVMIQEFSTNAMETFYNKHYRKNYPFIVTLLVIVSISFLKLLRVNKQKLVNLKEKLFVNNK